MNFSIDELDWEKTNLIPVTVQDSGTGNVLMLGFMNKDALHLTLESKYVTFFSRSKQRLWMKGEVSGNKLALVDIFTDCDKDSLLVLARPLGPTCHKNNQSCYGTESNWNFITNLEGIINQRALENSSDSYTVKLLQQGLNRIVQKVGEESIEVVIAALAKNNIDFCGELADLLFHILVLLQTKKLCFEDVVQVLRGRATKNKGSNLELS